MMDVPPVVVQQCVPSNSVAARQARQVLDIAGNGRAVASFLAIPDPEHFLEVASVDGSRDITRVRLRLKPGMKSDTFAAIMIAAQSKGIDATPRTEPPICGLR